MFPTPATDVRVVVVVRGNDVTFAGTEVDLRKVHAKIFNGTMSRCAGPWEGARKIRKKLKMLGRTLRWTDDGLEHEADEKHQQALLQGIGISVESKTLSSAAVRTERRRSRGR